LSGASTEASSVITQLSQALGSGVLRGEEFNAIMENGGRLAKLLADGMKTTVGGLRNMAQNGELTTDKIVPLLTNVELLRKEFETLPASISGSAQKVQNSFMAWVGGANDAVGASTALAGVLDSVATISTRWQIQPGCWWELALPVILAIWSAIFRARPVLLSVIQPPRLRWLRHRFAALRSVLPYRGKLFIAQKAVAAATSIEAQIAAERQLTAAQAD
jgi:tape measure domain-containing protein